MDMILLWIAVVQKNGALLGCSHRIVARQRKSLGLRLPERLLRRIQVVQIAYRLWDQGGAHVSAEGGMVE